MTNVITKEATQSDITYINEVMLRSLSHWPYTNEELNKIMDLYKIDEAYLTKQPVYLVYDDDIFLGFFSFTINQNQEDELDYFLLKSDLIGKGYGKMMWNACCDKAKSLSIKEFIIMSTPDAKGFYQKMGAQEIGECQSKIRKGVLLPLFKFSLI